MMVSRKTMLGLTAVGLAAGVLAWSSTIHARPNTPRIATSKAADIVPAILGQAVYAPQGPVCECTGFEPVETPCDWDLGFMCGPEFAACVCGGGSCNGICTGDPLVDQNCCSANPNPGNGWYMSISAEQCAQPHISDVNPSLLKPLAYGDSDRQHLRFERDPTGGDVPGCVGFQTQCRQTAFTPTTGGPLPVAPNTSKFDIAMIQGPGCPPATCSSHVWFTVADNDPAGSIGHSIYFHYYGLIFIYDPVLGGYALPQVNYPYYIYMPGNGTYQQFAAEIDPCNDVINYYIDGNLAHTVPGYIGTGTSNTVERSIFNSNNQGFGHDIDNYCVERGSACPTTCGNNIAEPGDPVEDCDGTDDANCPNRCFPPGDPNQCTCALICEDCATACDVTNGENGPFLTSGGFYRYVADTPFTSVNTCGSNFDTEILWDLDANCGFAMGPVNPNYNDECIPSDFGGFQAPGDPSAPCFAASGFPGVSCACWPTVPGNTYHFAVSRYYLNLPPGVGTSTVISVLKKNTCGEPIPNGACCDSNGPDQGCVDNVPAEQCVEADETWYENKTCDLIDCRCIPDCTGAECGDDGCGGSCGSCDDMVDCTKDSCGTDRLCVNDADNANCDNGDVCDGLETCDPVNGCQMGTPLVCNDGQFCNGEETCNPSSGCVPGTDPCAGTERPSNCDEDTDTCIPKFTPIPTVSEWGLVVLALLLAVGGKIYFGRRRTATA